MPCLQQHTGSVIHARGFFLNADVQCRGGLQSLLRRSDSVREVHFHFCPECGTSVYWHADGGPGLCGIAVGCFADPDFPAPSFSIWEESVHLWLGLPANIGRFSQGIGTDVVDQMLRDAQDNSAKDNP